MKKVWQHMNENNKTPAEFLDDEEQEGVAYIKPNLEMKLSPQKKQDCRDIVLEIKNYGINQRQIIFLIELLSFELENMEHIKLIRECLRQCREGTHDSSIIIERG